MKLNGIKKKLERKKESEKERQTSTSNGKRRRKGGVREANVNSEDTHFSYFISCKLLNSFFLVAGSA